MRALQIVEFGTQPRLAELPKPVPGPGEVAVRIATCGLNFADLLMIEGRYQERPDLPFTLGMELAGTVQAVGEGVDAPAPGTRVAVFAGHGGLADYGCFPAERCLPLPDGMSFEHAAAFQVAYGTSHVALRHRARLQPGETLLVLGAAGGVGLTAVEIGKLMGARVIAVARGKDKLEVAKAAGADHLIDSDTADIRAEVKALGGADVCYDPVGGDQFKAALRAMRPEGRIIPVGFASGEVPQIAANHLLVKNLTVIGLYWGGYLAFRPKVLTESLAELLGWYADGKIKPHVSHTLPLDRAEEALELLRARKSTGKVVVTMEA
ncbi:NADPH:quinone oxidoreductase family protein [Ostreiculturibacter nitratireducens]|uniref:NADPH:quinone oxidoreductase family protein n=1 Tax=Ostreiculturibacter nitratireducens TaxID=3075226 RepID=UPI0031B62ECD